MQKLVIFGLAVMLFGGLVGAQEKGKVEILGVWSGEELASFQDVLQPFIEQTGIQVEFVGTRDLPAVLTIRVAAGNPPDLAILPNPGQMVELARDGQLVPLGKLMDLEALRTDYGPTLDDCTYDGTVYGFFFKMAVKSLVWYRPQALAAAGYEVPTTWAELMAITTLLANNGIAAWAVGLESGAASGWPGTDWIEDIMLRTAGPELYDKWVNHEIPWTHPAVKRAFELFGAIVRNEAYVYGGTTGALSINFGDSPAVLFTDPPGAYFHRQASFITAFFPEGLKAGVDYDFFPLPAINPEYGTPVLVAGDMIVAFVERREVSMLLEYLASAEAQAIWATRGGYLTANRSLSVETYPDALTQRMAAMLVEAEVVRFDASDLMPAAVGSGAFWKGVLDYVSGVPLDRVLADIEAAAAASY